MPNYKERIKHRAMNKERLQTVVEKMRDESLPR